MDNEFRNAATELAIAKDHVWNAIVLLDIYPKAKSGLRIIIDNLQALILDYQELQTCSFSPLFLCLFVLDVDDLMKVELTRKQIELILTLNYETNDIGTLEDVDALRAYLKGFLAGNDYYKELSKK